jgi:hypothetical protein
VSDIHEAGSSIHDGTEVVIVTLFADARMKAHANPDRRHLRPFFESQESLCTSSCDQALNGRIERSVEPVAGCLEYPSAD